MAAHTRFSPHQFNPYNFLAYAIQSIYFLQPTYFSPHNSAHIFSAHAIQTTHNSAYIQYTIFQHIQLHPYYFINPYNKSPRMVAVSHAFHILEVLKCNIITSIHQFNTHPKSQVSNFNLLLHPEQQQHICNSSTSTAQQTKAQQQQRSG